MTTAEESITTESAGDKHRVVVGVDGSEGGRRALEWAAAQAERTGAVLDVHTAYDPGYVFVSSDEVGQSMQRILDEAAALAAKTAPRVTTMGTAHEAPPAPALIEASDGADLLVVGSRGLGGFRGLLVGSVSQQCSLHARCPVVIVR